MTEKPRVRVRFAPSPTGWLHIGGARTALFNWLFAKSQKGDFILRIEDTDKERSKPEFEEDIKTGLTWLGLNWDELYRQSERVEDYRRYLEDLLRQGWLYYCFCTKEELEAERQAMMAQGLAPKYSSRCRNLSKEEVEKKLAQGEPSVLRFKVAETKLTFKDLIRGSITFDTSLIGDIIVARNLDEPLYNFAVTVDDALMRITHVIRGEEHISNTPRQILLAKAMGAEPPQFAHLPLILNPDRSKMSKRFSDTALRDYVKAGYTKDAMVNFLTYLGWHPKEDKDAMTAEEIIKEFDLKRVQKAGAIFSVDKLDWLNAHYLKQMPPDVFMKLAQPFLLENWKLNEAMVRAVRGRVEKLGDLKELVGFYFEMPDYKPELLKWQEMTFEQVVENLEKASVLIADLSEAKFEEKALEDYFFERIGRENRGEMLWPLRVALSGKTASPGPFEILAALGKEESLKRVEKAVSKAKID
ncbi:MAG: glutamate--tRNA ligase [Candidatus Colwellbacteria bacterium]|nr:glutamate--tRNA ligase [Candidatus Colwellbacteria bacterium]